MGPTIYNAGYMGPGVSTILTNTPYHVPGFDAGNTRGFTPSTSWLQGPPFAPLQCCAPLGAWPLAPNLANGCSAELS